MNKTLSIIIPVYNNWKYTKNCLNNLLALDKELFEIIVVDNASSDETKSEVEKLLPSNSHLIYIRNDTNLGFGGAINKAYKVSCGISVMILNNDVKFGSSPLSWFAEISKISITNPNVLIGPTGGFVDPKKNYNFVYETNDTSREINYMSGWCLTAQKTTWDKLVLASEEGPFDSKTFFLYYEDTDLSLRATVLGIKFLIVSTPLIHIGKQTSKLLNTSKHYSVSREKFIKKWKIK